MRNRCAIIPQLESMEGRVVPSQVGGHLVHSASVEFHRLGKSLNNAYHSIRHNLEQSANPTTQAKSTSTHWKQTQAVSHPQHAAPSKSGFQGFFDSFKSLFKF